MTTTYKPMLAPNTLLKAEEIPNLNNYLVSLKLDGIRVIFIGGQMLSRSLKEIPNKQLQERFQHLKDYSRTMECVIDGEIYSHELTFQEIQGYVMTDDITDPKTVKKRIKEGQGLELPKHLEFHCFDILEGIQKPYTNKPFSQRILEREDIGYMDYVKIVDNVGVLNAEHLNGIFLQACERGFEGLMVRHKDSPYKFGRGTIKEGYIFKFKPYESFDCKIIGFVQETRVREGAEKKINELGRSVTSKKMEDRVPIEALSAYMVKYNGEDLKVSCSSLTHEERNQAWNNRESDLGKVIEFKAMEIGSKTTLRHPVLIRFRHDK